MAAKYFLRYPPGLHHLVLSIETDDKVPSGSHCEAEKTRRAVTFAMQARWHLSIDFSRQQRAVEDNMATPTG